MPSPQVQSCPQQLEPGCVVAKLLTSPPPPGTFSRPLWQGEVMVIFDGRARIRITEHTNPGLVGQVASHALEGLVVIAWPSLTRRGGQCSRRAGGCGRIKTDVDARTDLCGECTAKKRS